MVSLYLDPQGEKIFTHPSSAFPKTEDSEPPAEDIATLRLRMKELEAKLKVEQEV